MINRNQSIIVYCTIVAFAILYEHRPLLPLPVGLICLLGLMVWLMPAGGNA